MYFEGINSNDWTLAKETFFKLGPSVTWERIVEEAAHDSDPYRFGVMLWWLYERQQSGVAFQDIYRKISYVMGIRGVIDRMRRFKEMGLPYPEYKPQHLQNLFSDFLIDLKRTLQLLEPSCREFYFHTAI